MRLRNALLCSASLLGVFSAAAGRAQTAPQTGPAQDFSTGKALDISGSKGNNKAATEQIEVVGKKQLGLNQHQGTGSKLGLTIRETPATVVVVGAQTIKVRGYSQIEEAIDSTPGTTSGGSPADPTGFSMRSFTGDQITILRNGVYEGPANMISRPENSFNLTDIEILKGPASVLYGQGAVGGVINVIPKQPVFGKTSYDGLFSYGSFGTINAGVGMGTQIGDKVAVRIDLSRTSSNGFVHNDNPNSLNLTSSVLWHALDNLQLEVSLDYTHDNLPSYYGTPLIPGRYDPTPLSGVISSTQGLTIDAATRFNNYNVDDATHTGSTYLPNATLSWEPADNVVVTNEAYMFYANRRWENAETYSFIGPGSNATDAGGDLIPADSIARDRFHVYHQQHYYVDQLHAVISDRILGLANKFTVGVDGSYLDFVRTSGFPNAQYADYVSLLNPNQGKYGNFAGDYPSKVSPTYISNIAGLFEDSLSLTSNFKLLTGVRYEWLALDRQNYSSSGVFNASSSFKQTFHPVNYRVGLTYDVIPDLTLYAEYTTAQDPPGSNIFLVNRGQLDGLTSSSQEEVGAKGNFLNGRGEATLSLYHIERQNILVSTSPSTVADVGSQHSTGAEFSTDIRITPSLVLNANAAYTRARYGTFVDPYSGASDNGHTPPDVPTVTSNVWLIYSKVAGLPLDLGGGFRYVSAQEGDFANTLKLSAYPLFNIFATYHVLPSMELTGRINNLFNKAYVQWADTNYPSELLLGEPRYFEISLRVHL